MRKLLAFLLCALPGFVGAQPLPYGMGGQAVQTPPPASLHLNLSLAKDHFFQGEQIDTTLDFSNDDPDVTYGLELAGWLPGAKFQATDVRGNPAIDPLGWWYEWIEGRPLSGPVEMRKLGQTNLHLPVNEDVRFDQTGVYTLYAQALVSTGANFKLPAKFSLVSNKVTLTIDPLTPAQEHQVIADALSHMGTVDPRFGPDAPMRDALNRLKYLQTPASRAELIKLMNQPALLETAAWGLEAAPDPSAAAADLLAAVKSGQVVFNPYGLTIYGELKAFPLLRDVPANETDADKKARYLKQGPLMEHARQEMKDALVKAPHATGQAQAEALWTAFEDVWSQRGSYGEPDADGGTARRAVAAHQLELTDATVHRLLENWTGYGSVDFLPVVRREVARSGHNPNALIALCTLEPDEARPLVLTELPRPDSLFFRGSYVPEKLLAVPPLPLPELDDFFSKKLVDPDENPGQILPIVACFGSAHLLSTVLDLNAHHGTAFSWGEQQKMAVRFYWLRCDPKAAVADFENDLASDDNAWTTLYMTLTFGWSDTALPLVRATVKSTKSTPGHEAMNFLIQRGDDTDLGSILAVLERAPADKSEAKSLLTNPRFHPTAEQKQRLETVAESK